MIERGAAPSSTSRRGSRCEDPAEAAGEGGWGLGYAFSKGALHRIAGIRVDGAPTTCGPTTCSPDSSPPSGCSRTWARSGSTRRPVRPSRWWARCAAGC